MAEHWMPTKRQDQLDMAINWVAVLSETHQLPDGSEETNAAAWGVPEDKVIALNSQCNACAVLLAKLKDPETATAVNRAKCKAAFTQLRKLMRKMHAFFYLDTFPEEELSRLGLPLHNTSHTPRPDPTDHVECWVEYDPTGHVIYLHYKRVGVKGNSKGKNHGVEVLSVVLPLDAPAPVDDEDFTHSDIDTENPFRMEFKPHQAGMRVWFKLRWENGTGGKGEWSVLYSAIIP